MPHLWRKKIFLPDAEVLMNFIQNLKTIFKIYKKPKIFLGIQIEHDEVYHRIFIHQGAYINKLIKKFGQKSANEVSVRADPHTVLSLSEECETEQYFIPKISWFFDVCSSCNQV